LVPGFDGINDQPILGCQRCALDPKDFRRLDLLRVAFSPCAMARWFSVAQLDKEHRQSLPHKLAHRAAYRDIKVVGVCA
jgi:hypothetical protein